MDFCKFFFNINWNHIFKIFTFIFSVSASATVYAYLGEFHNVQYRSRAIMCASVIFGLTCILLPLISWLVINQEWEFYIPVIDIVFKPWRMFMVVCGLPSLLCFLALLKIPESPKFVLSQGKQDETIAILQRIHRINNGNDSAPLQISSIIEEIESVENRRRISETKKGGFRIFSAMWAQTAPLFMQPYVGKTVIACAIQFGIFATSNGVYMWFPEILNRMAEHMEENPGQRITMCEVLQLTRTNLTDLMVVGEEQDEVCTIYY